ncbi:hypothetical protein NEUTE1DRAFT_130724 [Neurospora tetrasperma FGSC 2508]|uniref:Uncharacterized protein n=1 Tax=Neurospora tetrasperma (strain FGSC 2508 / ATCC MYA-4615 / P0657) TaxID=510951 RepID=F8MRN9_NEUT8|nr:uncharacterized protein NEUTE1DRAFT_130724 [Neurospora tetrasperma FGSC 2508]EGO56940.1 hypothetical protein NEUTE1DRAFT_130724 [Neurospora tetrasperma FGSC 2508]EGZ70158.1 hypothetical protein NEUTE2DRAFT_158663 [Neurospora tetrasperma FGSC 2509]
MAFLQYALMGNHVQNTRNLVPLVRGTGPWHQPDNRRSRVPQEATPSYWQSICSMAISHATRQIHQNALRPSLFIYSCPTVYTNTISRPRGTQTQNMSQSKTPFLSRNFEKDYEENVETESHSTTDVDLEDALSTTTHKNARPHRRPSPAFLRRVHFRSCPDLILYLFALWGFLSLVFQLAQLFLPITPIFPSYHAKTTTSSAGARPGTSNTTKDTVDVYRPSTFPSPSYDLCSCGSSIREAQSLHCVYDTMAAAWLPPYCRDPELTTIFDRSGPGEGGAWSYYADQNGSVRLSPHQISLLADNHQTNVKGGNVFWATREWHLAHCLFYWQKLVRMRDTNAVMERRFDGWRHARHCYGLLMRRDPPGRETLLEVDVRLSGGFEMGREEKGGHKGH